MPRKDNVEAIYPLSHMQAGMMFHTLSAPSLGMYFDQLYCTLQGDLDIPAFQETWGQVIALHPVLRSSFIWEHLDEPVQVVQKQVKLPWYHYDWRDLSADEQQLRLEKFLLEDRARGFDLARAPLMRFTLVLLGNQAAQFIWSVHHIVLDGWSQSVLLKDVFACYDAFSQGKTPVLSQPRAYRDYIAWLRQQDLGSAEQFWRRHLQGIAAPTPLGINHGQPSEQAFPFLCDEQEWRLSEATTKALLDLARQQQVTINTVVQGAWALLLSHYSGEVDVVFGVTSSGRPPELEGVEEMVGLFINTLPMRLQVGPKTSFLPWLRAIHQQQAVLLQYEYSPLVQIQSWSDVSRGLPLFESIIVFENYPVEAALREYSGRLNVQQVRWTAEQRNYPIVIGVSVSSEPALRIHIGYRRDYFDTPTIERLLKHLNMLLEGIAVCPERQLSDFPILTIEEREQLLHGWNSTQMDFPQEECLHTLIESLVVRSPERVAISCGDEQVTYQVLDERANQLAHYLQELGGGPEVPIGLCMEQSPELVVGILGILKVGGVYVPLDPDIPQDRLAFFLQDARISILLTQQYLLERLPTQVGQLVLCLDTDWNLLESLPCSSLHGAGWPDQLAYMIYTSGSTGTPKGVMISHSALINHMTWIQTAFPLTSSDHVLQKTSISFDVSVCEFFEALLVGARLIVASPGGRQDSAYLISLLEEQQITIAHFVPSMLQTILDVLSIKNTIYLRRVYCGGENMNGNLWQQSHHQLDADIQNLYGPTETCIDATALVELPEDSKQPISIGRPIANTQVYVLDTQLQPVPLGVLGELYIGGVGLARGYFERPELTAERFIPHPFSNEPGERLYRTGDLVYYMTGGEIVFIGRNDMQVKIRGYRIELGEIEATLREQSGIQNCIVLAREDTPGDKYLAAYLVLDPKQSVTMVEVRRALLERLPAHMVPAIFIPLDEMPFTPSGKINRQALPAPEGTRFALSEAFVAPRTPIEETLAELLAQMFSLERVGIYDNFFELGGHSLLATQLLSRVYEIFQTSISIPALFAEPTIAGLAEAIMQATFAQENSDVLEHMLLDIEKTNNDDIPHQ